MLRVKKPIRPRSKRAGKTAAGAGGGKRGKKSTVLLNYYVPALFLLAMTGCLVWLMAAAYQKVTASSFFGVKAVEIYGTGRASEDDIRRTVQMSAAKTGVWNADIAEIRAQVEKLPWVRSAVVSRVLPDGLRVRVRESVPAVAVKTEQGELLWMDSDANVLGAVTKDEARSLIVLKGWEEKKTEGAQKLNQQRVKLYQKIMEELRLSGLDKRINAVNISDLEDTQAFVDQAGVTIPVSLGREDFAKRLQDALKTLESRDSGQVASLISRGKNVVVVSR
jgi:cell division septal protein FtsQ